MTTIKISSIILALSLISGCATSPFYKKLQVAPVTSISPSGRLQCNVYHLPEFSDTPLAPGIDLSSNSRVPIIAQKTALVVYIDQLRNYIGSLKGNVRAHYMRYLLDCVD